MKNTLRSLLAASLLVPHVGSVGKEAPFASAPVGRFQMLEATFTNAPGSAMAQFKRLAILDTATGVLTVCDYAHKDGGKAADGQDYWLTNGSCVPFVGDKPWYVPKDASKAAAKDKSVKK